MTIDLSKLGTTPPETVPNGMVRCEVPGGCSLLLKSAVHKHSTVTDCIDLLLAFVDLYQDAMKYEERLTSEYHTLKARAENLLKANQTLAQKLEEAKEELRRTR